MKMGLRTVRMVEMVFLPILALVCTGCVPPRSLNQETYSIENEEGLPFLVPSLDSPHLGGNTQTVPVFLKDGSQARMTGEQCSIASAFFGLSPKSGSRDRWQFRSLTANAWAWEQGDVYEDWKLFLQKLASPEYAGCFSTKEDLFSIRRTLVAAMPLPASEIDGFLYSDDKNGYVDLAPGMEILIRAKPRLETARDHDSDNVRFRIEARKAGGVLTKKVSSSGGGESS
jgi:hypothetical protein